MANVIVVGGGVDIRDLFKNVANFSLMSAVAMPRVGVLLVVAPETEATLLQHLLELYGDDEVHALEAKTFVPENWDAPGFINSVLAGVDGPIALVLTSGLGLHVSIQPH